MPTLATIADAPLYNPDSDDSLHAELTAALARNAMSPADIVAPVEPILVSVDFKRSRGKCLMLIDARPFHRYLDAIGVPYDASRDRYADAPYMVSRNLVNPDTHKINALALLQRPAGDESVVTFDLMALYSVPPTADVLERIGESVDATIEAIVDHYRPIEISVRVHSKVSK